MESNRIFFKRAVACNTISKVLLYDCALSTDYEYYETKPDDFPENKKFQEGLYFKQNMERVAISSAKHLIIDIDGDGVKHAYLKPKIEIFFNDGTSTVKTYNTQTSAMSQFKKITKLSNLLEI